MDRVTNISWRTTSGATLGGFSCEYDALGRITSRSHTLGDPSQPSFPSCSSQKTYAYDDLDRLASDGDLAYTYEIKNEVDAGKMVATEAFRSLEAEKMATTIAVKMGIKRR